MSRGVRYHVISKIAHGGMAEIFLAVQGGAEGFQKQVVLKRILPALSADPSFVRMLIDEAHIASTLNHSNLVQVLDLGKANDQFFLVLEFVDGWSLEQVRRRAQRARMKFPLPVALYIVGALCRALAYVHTRKRKGRPLGIVHRDVTPQNVLLSREGEVKLADFGIAKALGKREKSATGIIKGKFAYMSPEQSIGGDLDGRSDLFSVGTVLYLLSTGRKPFEGATDLDVLMQVRKARYEKPSALVKDFNPEVERFIARALRADRERRWQSAEQMADRLDAIIMKAGQSTGPAVLKRWLENLGAKDGLKPPAELAESSLDSDTIELGSRDLELEELSPPPMEDDDPVQVLQAQVPARGETRAADVLAALIPPVPPVAPAVAVSPSETMTPTMTATATTTTATAGSSTPSLASLASPPSLMGPPVPSVTAAAYDTIEISQAGGTGRAGSERESTTSSSSAGAGPAPGAIPPVAMTAATPEGDVSREGPRAPAPSTSPRKNSGAKAGRVLRRHPALVIVALAAAGGAAYFSAPRLPPWLVEPVRAWLQRLPVPGGPDWTGDPRTPEPPQP